MSTGTGIEWTQATWNPVVGCTRASAGCDNCYAVTMTHRLEKMGQAKYAGLTVLNNKGDRHFNGKVRCVPEALMIPLKWKNPRRIFVNSMSDLFHKDVPDQFIRMVFAVMSYAGQHTFQILTKRPERMAAWFADPENDLSSCQAEYCVHGEDPRTPTGRSRIRDTRSINGSYLMGEGNLWPLPNVWLGTSVENQAAADERIQHLKRCPAAVSFLSIEPLIGPVDIHDALYCPRLGPDDPYKKPLLKPISWVIVGGESGGKARPCDVGWIRGIVRQCAAAGVPCFVKQLGSHPCNLPTHVGDGKGRRGLKDSKGGDINEWPDDLRVRQFPVEIDQ